MPSGIGLCVIFRLVSLKFAVAVTRVLSPAGYFKLKICIATQRRQVVSLLHNETAPNKSPLLCFVVCPEEIR
jgi:hypothetical protein